MPMASAKQHVPRVIFQLGSSGAGHNNFVVECSSSRHAKFVSLFFFFLLTGDFQFSKVDLKL